MQTRFRISAAFVAMLALAVPALGAGAPPGAKYWHTYPQPPRPKPDDPMRVNPSTEVPLNAENYVWKTKRDGGKGGGTVKTYDFDYYGRGTAVGTAPEGMDVKIEQFRLSGRTLFYGLQVDGKLRWISGRDIVAASYTPPAK